MADQNDLVSGYREEQVQGVDDRLLRMRHSASHVMADAVLRLFPGAKLAIGPPIEEGFYYDIDLPRPLTPEDLREIEKVMAEIVKADHRFERFEKSSEEALAWFRERNQPYKIEIVESLGVPRVGFYQHGSFIDLCKGPHVESTGRIGAFRLLHTSGAYWRGDEKRPMLQRIYGTAFPDVAQLEAHLKNLEERKKADHRRLGQDLDLFSVQDQAGGGLIFWHPKGALIRHLIEDFWKKEHLKRGYQLLYTPHIAKADLWKTSGHLEFYRESMYSPMDIDGLDYIVKPMNCPGHILVYKSTVRSYRELPLRYAELGTVYRYERSGALHGMFRVRGFTQDDSHVFCTEGQLQSEIQGILALVEFLMKETFGFDYRVYLSTRPAKFVGNVESWDRVTEVMKAALEARGIPYKIDPGGGAFYAPKIDFKLIDSMGQEWQCSTAQVDFNLPERFGLEYVGQDGNRHRVYMIHRAIFGSLERFFAGLVEHYKGSFPLWLAPVQVQLIPVTEAHIDTARATLRELVARGFRAEVDEDHEKMSKKIRKAQLQRVPYMGVIGDREVAEGTVSLRHRTAGDLGAMQWTAVFERLEKELAERR